VCCGAGIAAGRRGGPRIKDLGERLPPTMTSRLEAAGDSGLEARAKVGGLIRPVLEDVFDKEHPFQVISVSITAIDVR